MRRGRPKKVAGGDHSPTLKDLGITKQFAYEARRLAEISEAEIDRRIAAQLARRPFGAVTIRSLLRADGAVEPRRISLREMLRDLPLLTPDERDQLGAALVALDARLRGLAQLTDEPREPEDK